MCIYRPSDILINSIGLVLRVARSAVRGFRKREKNNKKLDGSFQSRNDPQGPRVRGGFERYVQRTLAKGVIIIALRTLGNVAGFTDRVNNDNGFSAAIQSNRDMCYRLSHGRSGRRITQHVYRAPVAFNSQVCVSPGRHSFPFIKCKHEIIQAG